MVDLSTLFQSKGLIMANDIVLRALRALIVSDDFNSTSKLEALDEYVKLSEKPAAIAFSISEFREMRLQKGRIMTIKVVRERFSCGLLEAMIIVKGIESHYDIEV
jgi:hypothetical protein